MLLYFILGILFISIIIPLCSFFQSFLDILIEYITYNYAYKVNKIKLLMEKQSEELEQEEEKKNPIGFYTQAIGFQKDDQEEYQQEEDE